MKTPRSHNHLLENRCPLLVIRSEAEGSAVLRSSSWKGLFPLPPCAILGILNQDAQSSQLIPNGITAGKIAAPASLVTLSQQRVDLLVAEGISSHQFRRCLVAPPLLLRPLQGTARNLRIPILEHSEDLIEPAECLVDGRDVPGKQLARISRDIPIADQLENRGKSFRGIQVVSQRRAKVLLRLRGQGFQLCIRPRRPDPTANSLRKGANPFHRTGRVCQTFQGEIQRAAGREPK